MIFIPGEPNFLGMIVSAVTFPGVIMHEMSHQLFCRIFRVPVFDVVYFRFNDPPGYVLHENVKNPFKSLMISAGPFLINTIVGVLLTFPIAFKLGHFNQIDDTLGLIMYWIGFSILANAFPSTTDAKVAAESVLKNKQVHIVWRILTAPIIGFMYAGALGAMAWLDFVYAIFMAQFFPFLFAGVFI